MYVLNNDWYKLIMVTISASEIPNSFAAVIETAQTEAVIVERRGDRRAVIISGAEYDRLMDPAEE